VGAGTAGMQAAAWRAATAASYQARFPSPSIPRPQAVFDIPEAIAVARRAMCAAQGGGAAAGAAAGAACAAGGGAAAAAAAGGAAALGRLQVLAYYGGMASYYW
jgi:hypothetical protein